MGIVEFQNVSRVYRNGDHEQWALNHVNLSLADIGIAIGSGDNIAREVADITIAAEDLRELVILRKLAAGLMKRIDRNYRFVIGFNGALILFGALGTLPPATSALLHNTSTILLGTDCMTNLLKDGKKP